MQQFHVHILLKTGLYFFSGFTLICGIGVLVVPKNDKRGSILALFLVMQSLWFAFGGIAVSETFRLSPSHFFSLSMFAYCCSILALYFLTRMFCSPSFYLRPVHSLFLLYPVFAALPLLLLIGDGNILTLYYNSGEYSLISSITSLTSVIFFILIFLLLRRYIGQIRPRFPGKSGFRIKLIAIILLTLVSPILWSLDKLFSLGYLWYLYMLSGAGIIVAFLFFVKKIPHWIKFDIDKINNGNDKRYAKSSIENINKESTLKKIDYMMKIERLYCNSDMSLNSLASSVGLSAHQLSELLNKHLDKNFASFVNGYRVQAAKGIMASRLEEKIINIAYEVGFNSLASFNRVFKNEVGITPTDYRKNCINRAIHEESSQGHS